MTIPNIFIASSAESLPLARELAAQLANVGNATLWVEAFVPGKTVVQSLAEAADEADFAVFLLTAEDVGRSRGPRGQAPQFNIAFELGFLSGRLGFSRTFLVLTDTAHADLPSDLAGVMYLHLPLRQGIDVRTGVGSVAAAIRGEILRAGSRESRPVDFSSCFISYSWEDKDFVAQL
jgi:predicted nucleotide-binding protein